MVSAEQPRPPESGVKIASHPHKIRHNVGADANIVIATNIGLPGKEKILKIKKLKKRKMQQRLEIL